MMLLKELLHDARWRILLAILSSALSAATSIGLIGYINRSLEHGLDDIGRGLLLFGGLLILLFISGVTSQWLLVQIGHRLVYQLRLRLVGKVLGTALERIERLGSPRIYNALTKDVTTVATAFKQLPISLYNGLLLLAGLAYMAWLSMPFFFLTLGVIALGVGLDVLLGRKVKTLMQAVRQQDDQLTEQFEAAIQGRCELGLSRERRHLLYEHKLEPIARASLEASVRADTLWAVNLNWTTLLVFVLIGTLFFLGQGLGLLSQQVVVGYVLAIMFLRTPISMILDAIPAVIRGHVALQAIDALALGETVQFKTPAQAAQPFGELRLSNVHYRYPGQSDEFAFELGPIDLSIRRGELIFIVGGNGSGKSTLAKLLTGLYVPTSGQVSLNGVVLDTRTSEWHREHFAAIFADFYLFADVLGEAGNHEGLEARVDHYLDRLGLAHKVEFAAGRLSTTALSQGQRKRLALLLLMMEGREVFLLDEWAADQDPVFRHVFYNELLPELKAAGKTVIAITHDDRYFDVADRVYRLDYGHLVDYDRATENPFQLAK
ncbi:MULTISPECIES: cyclic peptide export ABC transporter [unclassified Pseudomonas]|uniref:cyclic peptide export ABC transporter n=1 Tax=unclassified Pseudomonas TaxID=196821 RepID=UPI000876B299|nr:MULTISPECIES: cyclic peptide export ABC transporter [unclassified Pseudomonas]SCZ19802.1 putative ATP-binding cassette transporter [Pseudomonas sp. NFACC44-2]SDA45651.1 putative ATP-binding cassette transporter [Pseudomonas sp. NFACC51]SDW52768.1 putative ATP-binding cassette transporter [Pseudomonas sp. NFACC08-1]SEI45006.1 putative ATP-binding cassette transporter [Pseudomonas sp. NFACC07-1]SFH05522.1 putative ATP-binding cassette transporter [Pseudomonas sp. NFACC54]